MTDKIDRILDYAIEREQEAHDFYMGLADRAEHPGMKEAFSSFAREELSHKQKLENIKRGIKQGNQLPSPSGDVLDLKIADYTVEVAPSSKLSYQDALILAMKREKAAFRLYSDLAKLMTDPEIQSTFRALAQEEAKHKLRFEVEYDDYVFAEN